MASVGAISVFEILKHALGLLATYAFWTIIYRLYFHPLAKFPGPKLAAATGLYETYYDVFHEGGGRFYIQIARMHDEYGPIVRINPTEVHIRDSEWNEIYRVTRRTSKPVWYYRATGVIGSLFNTPSHEQHRKRREVLQPFFSPAAILRYLPAIEGVVDKLHDRLVASKGEVVNLDDAFRCLATDVATGFAFGKPFGHVDHADLDHESNIGLRKFARLAVLNRHVGGWLVPLMQSFPDWLANRMSKASTGVREFMRELFVVVDKEIAAGEKPTTAKSNIFRLILNSDLPRPDKARWRVAREGTSVVLAGTETTGSFLSTMTALMMTHPDKLQKLKREIAELEEGVGRKATYQELKELPYLTGVVNEVFRIYNGVTGRLPRIDERNDISYKEWLIPHGCVVSTTQDDTHRNPDIFHDPEKFVPERWLDPDEKKRLSKYLQPFGRGTRICLGMDLAYADIYLNIGRLFSPTCKFELELQDLNFDEDVKYYHDFFALVPETARGVRALVK